jgi:hypothetical protein
VLIKLSFYNYWLIITNATTFLLAFIEDSFNIVIIIANIAEIDREIFFNTDIIPLTEYAYLHIISRITPVVIR